MTEANAEPGKIDESQSGDPNAPPPVQPESDSGLTDGPPIWVDRPAIDPDRLGTMIREQGGVTDLGNVQEPDLGGVPHPLINNSPYEEYAREDSYITSEPTLPGESLYTDRFAPSEYVSLNPQPLPPEPAPDLSSAYEDVALNPQPLPPEFLEAEATFDPAAEVSLNPQPLPPRYLEAEATFDPAAAVSLNPQPLPPRYLEAEAAEAAGSPFDSAEAVSLNPQPLPPEVAPFAAEAALPEDLYAPDVQPPVVEPTVIPEDPTLDALALEEPITPAGQEFDEFSQ